MSRNPKVSVDLVVAAPLTVVVAVVAGGDEQVAAPAASVDERLVRPDSQVLSDGSTEVTFVEFLDFECEACGQIPAEW